MFGEEQAIAQRKEIIRMRASASRIGYAWLIANEVFEDLFYLTIGNLRNRFLSATGLGKPYPRAAFRRPFPEPSNPELELRFRTTD